MANLFGSDGHGYLENGQASAANFYMRMIKPDFPPSEMFASSISQSASKRFLKKLRVLLIDSPIYESHQLGERENYWWLKGSVLVAYYNTLRIYYDRNKIEDVELANAIYKLAIKCSKENNRVLIAYSEYGDIKAKPYKLFRNNANEHFAFHYNDDFYPVHEKIIDHLADNDKGLILLHGPPGTGKTTYIKSLIQTVKARFVIVPKSIVNLFDENALFEFLERYKDVVFILEDAEDLIARRDGGNNRVVSALLNAIDGILSGENPLRIVATFNCSVDEVDPALMRPGRLVAEYQFLPLTADRADNLRAVAGKALTGQAATLAEIYCESPIASTPLENVGFATRK